MAECFITADFAVFRGFCRVLACYAVSNTERGKSHFFIDTGTMPQICKNCVFTRFYNLPVFYTSETQNAENDMVFCVLENGYNIPVFF